MRAPSARRLAIVSNSATTDSTTAPAGRPGHGWFHQRAAHPRFKKLPGAATFIHEANSIPGRANRWPAPLVDLALPAFLGGPAAEKPVRPRHRHARARAVPATGFRCAGCFGLDPARLCCWSWRQSRRCRHQRAGPAKPGGSFHPKSQPAIPPSDGSQRYRKSPRRLCGAKAQSDCTAVPDGNGISPGRSHGGGQPGRRFFLGRIGGGPSAGHLDSVSDGGGQSPVLQRRRPG